MVYITCIDIIKGVDNQEQGPFIYQRNSR